MIGRSIGVAGVVLALGIAVGVSSAPAATSGRCPGGLPQGAEKRRLDPATFTTRITNPYWPMTPGRRWVYHETDGTGRVAKVVVTVTNRTRVVGNGVTARVVTDVLTVGGRPGEVTEDWYAQDTAGNIWYLGEQTAEYAKGKLVSTEGSWEAGVGGAEPGIAVPAHPKPGICYRQEYLAGEAEDRGAVLSVDEQVSVPAGHYAHAMLTRDTSGVEPGVAEYKLYARGVGPVFELTISGGSDRTELVRVSTAR